MESCVESMITPEISQEIESAFISKMQKTYTLIYVDYRDSFNECPEIIQECLDNNSMDAVFDKVNNWYDTYSECIEIIENLKETIRADSNYASIHIYLDKWIQDIGNCDIIMGKIEERENSDPLKELIENTTLRGRATLFSNYDCLPHNFDMNNTYRYDEYVKDIIDILYLNPAIVKRTFNTHGINTQGRWPNLSYRNGKEAVEYKDLADELLNQCCYGLLTFMGMFPLMDLYESGFEEYTKVMVPEGNCCGMYNSWNGGGSLMEMKLKRDLIIPVQRKNKTKYDRCEICVDERNCQGYSINEVYGMDISVWGKEFKLIN